MRKTKPVAVFGATLLLAAGCGSAGHRAVSPTVTVPSPGPGTTVARTATLRTTASKPGPTSEQLARQLLPLSSFPAGWRTTAVDTTGGSFCGVTATSTGHPSGHAQAQHVMGELPIFDEGIGGFRTPPVAVYGAAVDKLDHCTTAATDGVSLTVGRLSFPSVGQRSAAYQATGTAVGVTFGFDLVVVLKGHDIVVTAEGDFGAPDITQFVELTKAAVDRIPTM
jgi:hypothetical protein